MNKKIFRQCTQSVLGFVLSLACFSSLSCAQASGGDSMLDQYGLEMSSTIGIQSIVDEIGRARVDQALDFFEANRSRIRNQRYIVFFNARRFSGQRRFYVWDRQTDQVESYLTAHGKGSDPDHNGYATSFSNTPGSNKTSLGFYLTAERYQGGHGLSLRLDGLQASNSNARPRAIVIHGAAYVTPNRTIQGRSFGCPALEQRYVTSVINRIHSGALFYVFY